MEIISAHLAGLASKKLNMTEKFLTVVKWSDNQPKISRFFLLLFVYFCQIGWTRWNFLEFIYIYWKKFWRIVGKGSKIRIFWFHIFSENPWNAEKFEVITMKWNSGKLFKITFSKNFIEIREIYFWSVVNGSRGTKWSTR